MIKSSHEFLETCKRIVLEYENSHLDPTDGKQISLAEVFVVWYCKTLQNHKALLSTNLFNGMYYELTYNGDRDEIYLDAYKKWENRAIKIQEE